MTSHHPVRPGRVYDPTRDEDGARVLVDRLWPRGLSKQAAALDEWCRAVAPSPALRTWYRHDPALFAEFTERYWTELDDEDRADALGHLRQLHERGPLVLLTATRSLDISHAAVLADILRAG
ncbi:MAG: DUF488 family protein [Streptosporangiales bacterium]|nr:DUF488 family protein [Streptosporangiales bacterium]